MPREPFTAPDDGVHEGSERASSLDLFLVLARRKRLVLGLPLVATIVAIVVSLLMPKWYSATAKILPPQQSQSNAVAILGQLGVLAGGPSQALGLKNPSDVYVAMLRSRTVGDKLIARFDLKRVYDEELLVETRRNLAKHSTISAGREGVISIEVEDRDPQRAASLANAFVDELRNLTLHLAVSEAGQRRFFFEEQLKKAKNDLVGAETALKEFTEISGLVNPQGQVSLSVAAAAALRAQITAKEIQLTAMRSFATNSNPDLQRAIQELSALRSELGKLEKDTNVSKGDVLVPFGKAPGVGLEYVRRYRDMKYFETLYEVLAKQYEIARIDEAKDATLIQTLDLAVPPEVKSRPRRTLIVLITLLLTFICSVLTAFALDSLQRKAQDPDWALRIAELRRHFSWQRTGNM